MSTWVKICGTTNLRDAMLASSAGADGLGFIFAPSPRRIETADAAAITSRLPRGAQKVGLFMNEDANIVRQVTRSVGLDAVQLHGEETVEYIDGLRAAMPNIEVIKTLRMDELHKLKEFAASSAVSAVLIDSGSKGERGGTGQALDWKLARRQMEETGALSFRLIVAGGLKSENVAEAIRELQPWGVDVCTGVERTPGSKEPQKVRDFVKTAKAAVSSARDLARFS